MNNEIENQKKTNENLEHVINSMNKESYDNEELLNNLKNTIEKLKMQNKQGYLIFQLYFSNYLIILHYHSFLYSYY